MAAVDMKSEIESKVTKATLEELTQGKGAADFIKLQIKLEGLLKSAVREADQDALKNVVKLYQQMKAQINAVRDQFVGKENFIVIDKAVNGLHKDMDGAFKRAMKDRMDKLSEVMGSGNSTEQLSQLESMQASFKSCSEVFRLSSNADIQYMNSLYQKFIGYVKQTSQDYSSSMSPELLELYDSADEIFLVSTAKDKKIPNMTTAEMLRQIGPGAKSDQFKVRKVENWGNVESRPIPEETDLLKDSQMKSQVVSMANMHKSDASIELSEDEVPLENVNTIEHGVAKNKVAQQRAHIEQSPLARIERFNPKAESQNAFDYQKSLKDLKGCVARYLRPAHVSPISLLKAGWFSKNKKDLLRELSQFDAQIDELIKASTEDTGKDLQMEKVGKLGILASEVKEAFDKFVRNVAAGGDKSKISVAIKNDYSSKNIWHGEIGEYGQKLGVEGKLKILIQNSKDEIERIAKEPKAPEQGAKFRK